MNANHLIRNATQRILTSASLALAVILLLPHSVLAVPNGTSVLRFSFKSAMTNTVVGSNDRGAVNGYLNRQGNANSMGLTLTLTKLDPKATYRLVAYLGNDTNPTTVLEFITNSKGAYTVTYVKAAGSVSGGKALPDLLNPLCGVRELAIVNAVSQTVLRSDLTDPDSLQYNVNSFMANPGVQRNAVGLIQITASKFHTSFRLTASGLTPNADYALTINGNAAQTSKTDRLGKLTLIALPVGSTDVLGINMLALTDLSNGKVVLTTDGLGVPCDTTAPITSFTVPANTTTNVAINQKIAVTFSEALDPTTINTNTFTVRHGETAILGAVSYVGVTATFTPASLLANNTTYTATITTGAKDFAGNPLAAGFSWNFATGAAPDTTPPTVSFTVPALDVTGVATNQQIAAVFSEAMDPLTISAVSFTLKQGTTAVTGTVTYAGVTATFTPRHPLAASTLYTATITSGATDLAGNALATVFVWHFTTGAAPDTTLPTVSFIVPSVAATDVATNQQIAAVFSEAMDPVTISAVTFTLKQGTTAVTGTVAYAGVTATFKPISPLAVSTLYTATINIGATDLAGNALATPFVWHFTTGAGPDTNPPTVSFIVPSIAATDVATNQQLAAVFSEAMDPLTISTATFTLQQGTTAVTGTVGYAGVTATFKPINPLAVSTLYTATINSGATDLAGNALATPFVWHFTTSGGSDTNPPTVTSTINPNGAIGVPINTKVGATFSEAMDPLTISTLTFLFTKGGAPVAGLVTYSGVSAVFAPTTNLDASTTYTATITTGAKDLAGNALASDYVWSWTTGVAPDTTAPTLSLTIPANGASGVAINKKITAVFSEALDPLTITTTTFTLKQGSTVVTGTVSYANGMATFAPVGNLITNTTYTGTISTGAKDLAGNALGSAYVWSFQTGLSTDTNAPIVVVTNPTNTATAVSLNQTVNATFSEAMNQLTISTASFKVNGPGTTVVTGTVAYVAISNAWIASFTPVTNLAASTTYTNTVTIEATDLAGNALTTNYVWSFTTGTAIDPNKVAINLGSASTFAIMATDATSGSANVINGDVGLHPGVSQGIPPSEINGTVHKNDPEVIAAQAALLAAYNEAVSRSVDPQPLPANLGGLTLYPGLYVNGSSTGISGSGPTAILTLDAQGDPNAVFVFKMDSTLITEPGSSIVLSGGAQAKNIYWKVLTSATLKTTTIFKGNILADVSITLQNGCAVEGRLFAGSGPGGAGAVTVQSSIITVPAP